MALESLIPHSTPNNSVNLFQSAAKVQDVLSEISEGTGVRIAVLSDVLNSDKAFGAMRRRAAQDVVRQARPTARGKRLWREKLVRDLVWFARETGKAGTKGG
ncbi:hypothetical protein BaRGS_00019232 [Batillaria attramentaria]|uniref:Uncharacterized protein n=1 Tax=Batillaria attramentaria TaxID=370345 RepID=A0ABD0KRP0_9CAEN